MATRIGVDVGGTFTDLIYYDDETGEVRVDKEPTTPASPERGVIAAVEKTLGGGELEPRGLLPARHDRGPELAPHAHRRGRRAPLHERVPRHPRDPPRRPGRALQPVLAPAGAARPAPAPARGHGADPGRRRGARPLRGGRRSAGGRGLRSRGRDGGRDRIHERVLEPRARACRRERPPRRRLHGRYLRLAPGLRRVPRVRADLDDRHRRLRARSNGELPADASRTALATRASAAPCS